MNRQVSNHKIVLSVKYFMIKIDGQTSNENQKYRSLGKFWDTLFQKRCKRDAKKLIEEKCALFTMK